MPDPGDKCPSIQALQGVGRCSAGPLWVGTRSPVSANGASAGMLTLYQGAWWGPWSPQGGAKGCQSKTTSEGERWPGSGWENRGLGG